jgi:hypothetical protein
VRTVTWLLNTMVLGADLFEPQKAKPKDRLSEVMERRGEGG